MSITITGDLSWTGDLVLFLEALDGGPAADTDGYTFTSSGDMEYSCSITDTILGLYRCVAKTSGGIIAGAGYVTVGASTTAARIRSEEAVVLDPATRVKLDASQPDYDLPTNTELNAAIAASQLVITTDTADIPRYGDLQRFDQSANNSGNKTADVTITKLS